MDRVLPASRGIKVGSGRWRLGHVVFFTAIHIPLAFAGADGAREIISNVILLAGVAIGVRLLIARVDPWSGEAS